MITTPRAATNLREGGDDHGDAVGHLAVEQKEESVIALAGSVARARREEEYNYYASARRADEV